MPIQRFGIKDGGIINEGQYADILVFDFDQIGYKDDFLNPSQTSDAIEYVFVNRKFVYRNKKYIRAKPGMVLRKIS